MLCKVLVGLICAAALPGFALRPSRPDPTAQSQVCPYRSESVALMAHGGIARASSCTVNWPAEKAFDNNSSHFAAWYPDWWGEKPDRTAPWIERDLGRRRLIGRIVTRTVLSPHSCSFSITVSLDGQSYTEVASFDNVSNEVVAEFSPTEARFIRTTFRNAKSAPVVYEQMMYEAVPRGSWGHEPGARRYSAANTTVVAWPTETVGICGESFRVFVGIEEEGCVRSCESLILRAPGGAVSRTQLADATGFSVSGMRPGKRELRICLKGNGTEAPVDSFDVEFLPRFSYFREKPFFPLGVFYATRPQPIGRERWSAAANRDFPIVKELGANCLIIGPFTPSPEDGPFGEYVTLLDAAHRHGLKLLLPVWSFAVAASRVEDVTLTGLYPEVKATVDAVSRHPALLGYYLFDEPLPWYSRNLNTLERLLRSLDPEHPAVAVFTQPSQIREMIPRAGLRVNLIDAYPVTASQPIGDTAYRAAFAPDDRVEFGELMGRLRAAAPHRPFWLIPQAFGEGALRLPAPEELRQMCWLALSRGFTGVIPFALTTNAPDDTQLGLLGANNRRTTLYDETARLFSEISGVAPAMLQLQGTGRPIPASKPAEAMAFRGRDGRAYAVVVNRDVTRSVTARVDVPAWLCPSFRHARDVRTLALLATDPQKPRRVDLELDPGGGMVIRFE